MGQHKSKIYQEETLAHVGIALHQYNGKPSAWEVITKRHSTVSLAQPNAKPEAITPLKKLITMLHFAVGKLNIPSAMSENVEELGKLKM